MNVLSLFDGMSCAQIALNRIGIKPDRYFASEIDKYAIKVTQANYPETIQLGDIHMVSADTLPNIDLLVGGSPCQGFSFAGKQLNFNDPRSELFFEFVRILREVKPRYFLLENVRMKKEYQDVISEAVGVEPIKINSALVSAQNRVRLYWTNIPGVEQPEDRGLVLRDIIEDGEVDRDKSHCIDANYYKGGSIDKKRKKVLAGEPLLQSEQRMVVIANTHPSGKGMNGNIYSIDHKSPTLDTTGGGEGRKIGCHQVGTTSATGKNGMRNRVYSAEGKSPTLLASATGGGQEPKIATSQPTHYRKLTPIECERLQTVSDGYTDHVSNTQRYKMLGNGFTVDVIAHILKNMEIE